MAPIVETVDIARPPEEVFAYLDDLARHGEWQSQIIESTVQTDGPTRVGTRAKTKRKVPGGEREFRFEITEHDPPRRAAFQVLDGPLRPRGVLSVDPAGTGTRYTMRLDFQPHGILGRLLRPLAMRDARRQLPQDLQRLREQLESGAAARP